VSIVAGVDPMKPNDPLAVGPVQALPPMCPNVEAHTSPQGMNPLGLHAIRQNEKGDILYECLFCGYMAIWRKATDTYEKPANFFSDWAEPMRPERQKPAGEPAMRSQQGGAATAATTAAPLQVVPSASGQYKVEATGGAPSATGGAPSATGGAPSSDTSGAPAPEQEYVTVKEAAMILGVSAPVMLKKVMAGEIKSVAINGAPMIPVDSL